MFAYVRLCSPMFAYVRLMGEKMFEGNVTGDPETNMFDELGLFCSDGAYPHKSAGRDRPMTV